MVEGRKIRTRHRSSFSSSRGIRCPHQAREPGVSWGQGSPERGEDVWIGNTGRCSLELDKGDNESRRGRLRVRVDGRESTTRALSRPPPIVRVSGPKHLKKSEARVASKLDHH